MSDTTRLSELAKVGQLTWLCDRALKCKLDAEKYPGTAIIPTAAQTLECFLLCQRLTMFYRSIELVRLDERTGEVVIIAGEETQIAIARNGEWTFRR